MGENVPSWSIIDQYSLGTSLVFSVQNTRHAVTTGLKKSPPENIHLNESADKKSLKIEIKDIQDQDIDLIQKYEEQGLRVGPFSFHYQGNIEIVPEDLGIRIFLLKHLSPNIEVYLAITWPRDRIEIMTRNLFQWEVRSYEFSEKVYDRTRQHFQSLVFNDVKAIYKFTRKDADAFVASRLPSFEEMLRIWQAVNGTERRPRLSPRESLIQELNRNPQAQKAPPWLIDPITAISSRLTTQAKSYALGYSSLKFFHQKTTENAFEFRRYYDLYREGIVLLNECYVHLIQANPSEPRTPGESEEIATFAVHSIDYLIGDQVVLAFDPQYDRIFWSSFKSDFHVKLRDELAELLPAPGDYLCQWSRRSNLAMLYVHLLKITLKDLHIKKGLAEWH